MTMARGLRASAIRVPSPWPSPAPRSDDDAGDLLETREARRHLVERISLQRRHAVRDGRLAQLVERRFPQEQPSQLVVHHHDLEQPYPTPVAGVEAFRAAHGPVGLDLACPVSYTHLRAHETRHDLVC